MTRYALAPDASVLDIWTEKEGLLAKMAHDLQIGATGVTGEANVENGRYTLRVIVPVAGLQVRGMVSAGSTVAMSDRDRAEIEQTMKGPAVLDLARFPQVLYTAEGQGALPDPSGSVELKGELTLKGMKRPLPALLRFSPVAGGFEVSGSVRFKQSLFGMKPYSAMLGALKVKDELRVTWTILVKQVEGASAATVGAR